MSRSTIQPVLLFVVLLFALDVPAAADWNRFRGDPSQQGVARTTLPAEPQPVWTYRLPEGAEATAAIADGVVYVAGLSGRVAALDLATGNERWALDVGEEIKSSPLVADGLVYFGDEIGKLHAVDAKTGEERFVFEAEAAITGAPNLGGGCLLAPSYDNSIYCIDPKKGTKRWSVETAGYVHGSPALVAVESGTADGAVDTAIVSGCDGMLRFLDLADGSVRSEFPIGSYVAASPAVADGRVHVGTFDNDVVAIDLEKALAAPSKPAPSNADPAGAPTEAPAGTVLWRYDPERDFPFYSSPAVHDGLVFVGGRDKSLHAIDAKTGEARWTHRFRARVDASPLVVPAKDPKQSRVFIADERGVLAAFTLADGTMTWSFEGADGFAASPVAADGHLVIPAVDGTVYAFATPR